MNGFPLDVLGSGAVILGKDIVCDGFHRTRRARVQTHVHDDHMDDFNTSKGEQDLFMSEETYGLLVAEFNADLSVRENIFPVRPHHPVRIGTSTVTLVPSGHMLGAVQVLVETAEGVRLGYSGDFHWPLEPDSVIKCEALVVDSTYGSPESVREYSQEEAETRFLELVYGKTKRGSVHVHAHRGTIQRALQLLGGAVGVPIICSEHLCREIAVYQRFGSAIGSVVPARSFEAKAALSSGRYIRLYSKGDKTPVELPEGVRITLSAFMARRNDPVLEYSERAYRVALSNHADFRGTLDYIRATGARYVVTDNTRTHGIELAHALRDRLGIDARPSRNVNSHEWGE
jgi:putative mRNA 3-end processing factor